MCSSPSNSFLSVCVVLLTLAVSQIVLPSAHAQSSSMQLRVMVSLPKASTPSTKPESAEAGKRRRQTLALVTVQTAKRIKKRLLATGIGEVQMTTRPYGEITIRTSPAKSAQWLAQVVVPPGRLGLHEQLDQSLLWSELASSLPKGIEFRQNQTDSHLWSASRKTLDAFLSRLALVDRTVSLVPGDAGWRSVMWRGQLASEADIESASAKTSRMGAPFVAVNFKSKADEAWRSSSATRFVISLDGEAISQLGPAPKQVDPVATLTCIGSLSTQRDCTSQIVGRLSVPIPLPLVVLPSSSTVAK